MRKLMSFLFLALFFASGVFAEKILHNFDFSIPLEKQTWKFDDSNRDSIDAYLAGFNFDYSRMSIKDSGFSFIFGAYSGYTFINSGEMDNTLEGLDMGVKFGWGGTPIDNGRIVLSVHGFLGINMKVASTDVDEGYDGGEDTYTAEYTASEFGLKFGADAVLVFRLTNVLALNAGLDIYANFMGGATDYYDGYGTFQVNGGIGCVPRLGLTIVQE